MEKTGENMIDEQTKKHESPPWSSTTKLIVGLCIVAVTALIVVQLRAWVGILILAFVFAYLFYPLAAWLRDHLRFSWGLSVILIYAMIVIILLGLLTWGGITFVEPVQNLVKFFERNLTEIPDLIEQAKAFSFSIGPFTIDLSSFDLSSLVERLLSAVQPLLTRAGSLIGTFAAGAATIIGQVFFLLLISYFILAETKGAPNKVIDVRIPGYQEDLKRLGQELGRIWNAFLRGQLILMFAAILLYTILLGFLGMRFVLGLALLAGLARFIPYVGPWITWITYFLVALLQGTTIFGLDSWIYALVVIGVSILLDTIIDNYLSPKIYANALRVHPAAVLIAILVAAAWLGFIGIVLAAPVLATIKLFGNYAFQKLLDRDPWENMQSESVQVFVPVWVKIKRFFVKVWYKLRNMKQKKS